MEKEEKCCGNCLWMGCEDILGKSIVISMKLLTKLYYFTIRKQDV